MKTVLAADDEQERTLLQQRFIRDVRSLLLREHLKAWKRKLGELGPHKNS